SYPSSELAEHLEGQPASAARQTLTELVQDDYGNVIEERRWGQIDGNDHLSGHDEAIFQRTFADQEDDWILGVLTTEEVTDAAGDRVSMSRRYYDGDAFVGLPLGEVVRGDLSREEAWVGPKSDAFELVLGTRYDADGQPVETKDARGGGHVFDWAPDHTAIRAEHVKLDDGRELVETADVDGASGNLLAVREYSGQETRYAYDVFGRLTEVVRPGDGNELPTARYTYQVTPPLSRVITEARVEPGKTTVEHSESLFDGLGRSRGTLTKDGDRWVLAGVSLLDARGNAQRTLLPRWVDAGARDAPPILEDTWSGTDTYRDATGREIRTRSPSGIVARTEFWPLETRHWDGGQNDARSSYEHTPIVERRDGFGRLVARVQTLGGVELSALYTYDAAGDLLSRADPEGALAKYTYDGRGRRTAVADPDLGEHTFTYDGTSNLVAHTYPDGKTARFTFDLAGRSLTEDHDGDGEPEVTRTWDADPDDPGNLLARGKLLRVTGPSGETRHTYDERGRTEQTTLVIDGKTYRVGSEFDDQDRESRHIYPDGSFIDLHRNDRGQLSGYGQALSIDYGGDGLETERRFSTGVKLTSGYDDERRRTDLIVESRSGEQLESLHWSYDAGGNLASVQDRRPRVPAVEDRSEAYAYDNLYRLVGVTARWGTESWRFSASGSLLSRVSSLKALVIGSVDYGKRPHAPISSGSRKIDYDARGRMTTDGERAYTWNDDDQLVAVSRTDASETSTYDGDGIRRIRVERGPNGEDMTTHFIDAWSDARDGKLVRYVVHGGQRVARLASTGSPGRGTASVSPSRSRRVPGELAVLFFAALAAWLVRSFRGLRSVRRPVAIVAMAACATLTIAACNGDAPEGSAASKPHGAQRLDPPGAVEELTDADAILTTDLLGSLLDEADSSGNRTGYFAAYPFGAPRLDTTGETRKYAGAPHDTSVGLDAMGARTYAADLGVWTSGDPLSVTAPERLVGVEFAAANPYAYAKDSPTLAADHDGHFWQIAAGAFAGFLVGGAVEAAHQYLEHGKVEDWGRVGAAAAGGAVSGAIFTANPLAGLGSVMAKGAVAGAAEGVTARLIQSRGKDAGTLGQATFDAAIGGATAGLVHGGAKLVKAAIGKAPSAARAVASKVGSALEGGGACPCFAAGTLVATPNGLRPIDTLHPGDLVLSRDQATHKTQTSPVTRLFITPDKEVLELTFAHRDGATETITATPGHPFWLDGAGWTEARNLALGAAVQTAEGGLATLSATLSREERTTVYNLEVEGTHTYFVGETKAWVHNACGCGGGIPDDTLICRGGLCTADRFESGTGVTLDAERRMQGVSVNAAESVEAATRQLRSGRVGVTSAGQIRSLGGEVVATPTRNDATHATMSGITPEQAEALFTPSIPNPNK
ncbi:MAG TPA: polymorphic toxin-type HINT domain-containing protein, partial [Polyangiaceae bacterium]|nr:polymorphic toxin-type HINT domain-containing protein [Polyangiaceae bacterium]